MANHAIRRITARLVMAAVCLGCLLAIFVALNHGSSSKAFIGDSITEGWFLPRVNYGKHGETSAKILSRFPAQILGHGYRRVYVLAGTNDVLLHQQLAQTQANLEKMVDLAKANHIEPVLGEIPPIYAENGGLMPAVQELNRRIVALGSAEHVPVAPYYEALARSRSMQTDDGVHVRRRGYVAMEIALLHTSDPF